MRSPWARACAVAFVGAALLGAVGGCVRVAPYDRAKLAHPSMTAGDLARPSQDHVRSVQEGAVGGGFSAGGGCGCN